jgi:hypothetical protein
VLYSFCVFCLLLAVEAGGHGEPPKTSAREDVPSKPPPAPKPSLTTEPVISTTSATVVSTAPPIGEVKEKLNDDNSSVKEEQNDADESDKESKNSSINVSGSYRLFKARSF